MMLALNKKNKINYFYFLTVFTLFVLSCNKGGNAPGALNSTAPSSGTNKIYGRVTDAANGAVLSNVAVSLYSGATSIASTSTNASGDYTFSNLGSGSYAVTFSLASYVTINNASATINTADVNLNESMAKPTASSSDLRIVLSWYSNLNSSVVSDLDSYLTNSVSSTKIFYSTKTATWSDGSSGSLDHDVSSYSGPETITITNVSATSTYTYYINNYSQSTDCFALSQSGVHVDVYSGSSIVKSYDVAPNLSHGGVIYEVFKVINGQVVDSNIFNNGLSAAKTNNSCP
jgi:uncharacterized protein YfaP (DUF2135 family)